MAAQSAADCTPSTVTGPHEPSLASAVSTDFWLGPCGQLVGGLLGELLGLVLGLVLVLALGLGLAAVALGDAVALASATGERAGSPVVCVFAGWQAASAAISTA